MSRSVLLLLGMGVVASTAARADCTATVDGSTSIDDCLVLVAPGETIFLEPGRHEAPASAITKSLTIRPSASEATVFGRSGIGDLLSWTNTGGFEDDVALFRVAGAGVELEIVDVVVRPLVGRGADGNYVRGRVVEADRATVVLDGVRLAPWEQSGLVGDLLSVRPTSRDEPTVGGLLALALRGAHIVLIDVDISQIDAPEHIGAAVVASGTGSKVEVLGSSDVHDIRSAVGAIAVDDGASLTIGDDGTGPQPTLRELRAQVGGAIFARASTVTVRSGSFLANGLDREEPVAQQTCGGAVAAVEGSTVSIRSGTFTDNTATLGGAVCATDSEVTVEDSLFQRGAARVGGHIAVFGSDDSASSTSLTLDGVTSSRGHVALNAVERERNSTLPASERLRPTGASVFVASADLTVDASRFEDGGTDDHPVDGGAVAAVDATATVRTSDFEGNLATFGGAIFSVRSDLSVLGGKLVDNGEGSQAGGALGALGGTLVLQGSLFEGNASLVGGAVTFASLGSMRATEVIFRDNRAGSGGALAVVARTVLVEDSVFQGNRALLGDGGHLIARLGRTELGDEVGRSDIAIDGGRFSEGRAQRGGAIHVHGARLDADGVELSDNEAVVEGGAILVESAASLRLVNAVLRSNTAGERGGGLATREVESVSLRRVELIGNDAGKGGGSAHESDGSVEIVQGTACDNRAASGSALYVNGVSGAGVRLANTLVHGEDHESQGMVRVVGSSGRVEQNVLIGGSGPALSLDGSPIAVEANLFGWGAPANTEAVIEALGGAPTLAGSVVWPPDRRFLSVDGADGGGEPIVAHPHLRGALRDEDRRPACDVARLHPRPTSPLLLDGWPEIGVAPAPTARIVGIYGGEDRWSQPWEADADDDGMPAIFDCDEGDPELLERFEQYLDEDGDGYGGARWPGDACGPVDSAVAESTDCDDSDPTVAAICGSGVGYFGARCQTVGGGARLPLLAFASLFLLRRRRRVRAASPG